MENRLCIDCKHFVLNDEWQSKEFAEKYATCARTAYVNGKDGMHCSDLRATIPTFFAMCGPKGKAWEAK